MVRTRSAVLALVLAASLLGCSEDGDDAAAPSTTAAAATSTTTAVAGEETGTETEDETEQGSDTETEGGGDAGADGYVAALERELGQPDEEDALELDGDQASCLAERWVDVMDVDRLREAGVTPDDLEPTGGLQVAELGLELTEDEAEEMYEAFDGCGVDLKAELVASIVADGGLDADAEACLEDTVTEDLVRRVIVAGFTEGEAALSDEGELGQEYLDAVNPCAGP